MIALLEGMPPAGLKWSQVGVHLAAADSKKIYDAASHQMWAASFFFKGVKRSPSKLNPYMSRQGFSFCKETDMLAVALTEEGKKELLRLKGEEDLYDVSKFLNKRGCGNVITVIGSSGTGKTHTICEYILKPNLDKIGYLINGVTPENVCIFTNNQDSAEMYDKVLGVKGCCVTSAAATDKWADMAMMCNQMEPVGKRPVRIMIIDDPLEEGWYKQPFVKQLAIKAGDLNIPIIWAGQRFLGDNDTKCPIMIKNNSNIKVRLGGWSEESDWKAALNDLGGRTASGKEPFSKKKQLKAHFEKYTGKYKRQMCPLVHDSRHVWKLDTVKLAQKAAAETAQKKKKKKRKHGD